MLSSPKGSHLGPKKSSCTVALSKSFFIQPTPSSFLNTNTNTNTDTDTEIRVQIQVALSKSFFTKLLFISQYKYKYKKRYTGTNTNTVGLSKSFFIQAARFLLITLFDMLTIVIFGRIILIVFLPYWSRFEGIQDVRCGWVKMHLVGKFWHYGVYCTFLFYSRRSLSALTGALYITLRSCWNPFFFFHSAFWRFGSILT